MTVVVSTRRVRSSPIAAAEVRRRAERMLEALRMSGAELSILLCDDDTIHALNREYRKIDRATDVLAFAMREGKGAGLHPSLLGDVVISIDTARRQAREQERPVAAEVTFLLAHGLLHLLGFDHRTAAEERTMRARTDALTAAAFDRRARSALAGGRRRPERSR